MLGVDGKRMHIAHEMYRAADMRRAACFEAMNLHVDLASRKVAPWPERQHLTLRAAAAHAGLARPDWVGRAVRMGR